MAEKRTSKKVKVIGTETYINTSTGEINEMLVTGIEERDFNFHKVWMQSFIASLELVGNQKTKFALWIVDNITKENLLPMTLRQMAAKSGISLQTVSITIKALLDANFLRRINTGCYIVNPDIVFKGTRNARFNILHQFNTTEYVPLTDAEKIANLQNSISALQKQISVLQANILKNNKSVAVIENAEK